jgi:2-(1,2-epoxy-1,2-dihydrophenyl)acetyl-CoA isomerase
MTEIENDDSPVLLSRQGAVATITLNRPARKNAINDEVWWGLSEACRSLGSDPEIRVVVLTGAGETFCSGADLAGVRAGEHPAARLRRIGGVARTLYEFPKPVIAKVDGVAAGAGWNLALACDIVVASTRARFCQIFTKRGLSLDCGGSWILPRVVGLQQAKRLALSAEMIGADEAFRLGAVTWVKPVEELDRFVEEFAVELAALPPIALTQTKVLLNGGADLTLAQSIENEALAQVVNYATEDAPAAFRSFIAKSATPDYTGRWALSAVLSAGAGADGKR